MVTLVPVWDVDASAVVRSGSEPAPGVTLLDPFLKYSESQPRDSHGRFAGTGMHDESEMGPHADRAQEHSAAQSTLDKYTASLQKTFPNALIDIKDGPPSTLAAIDDSLSGLAAQWPKVASQVALVRIGADVTPGMGESIITTVRTPDGQTRQGFGLLLNPSTSDLGPKGFRDVTNAVNPKDGSMGQWDYNTPGDHIVRSNSFSIKDYPSYVASTTTHEWGHLVHMTATERDMGEGLFSAKHGGGINRDLWDNVTKSNEPSGSGKRGPLTERIGKYYNESPRNGTMPPSTYGSTNPAEMIAEGFTIRHGPEGVGALGPRGTLDPGLNSIMDSVEAGAK